MLKVTQTNQVKQYSSINTYSIVPIGGEASPTASIVARSLYSEAAAHSNQ
jgi:hypothetical protein